MKPLFKKHMKNMTSFIALILVFYIFVYYMITAVMVVTYRSFDLHVSFSFLAHVIASLMILLTLHLYDPNKDGNNKIDKS